MIVIVPVVRPPASVATDKLSAAVIAQLKREGYLP